LRLSDAGNSHGHTERATIQSFHPEVLRLALSGQSAVRWSDIVPPYPNDIEATAFMLSRFCRLIA
jgi:hypothetical protein